MGYAAPSSAGSGGTQYTEGDTDASITGTAALMEVAANTLQPVQGTVADGLLVNLGANNDITGTVTAELSAVDNAVLDTIDAVLDTIKVDTEAIEIAVEAIQAAQLPDGHNVTVDNASIPVTGTFWQATQPVSGTVTAELSAVDNAVLDAIATSVAGATPAGTNNIGDVDVASIAAGDNNIGNVDIASAIPAGTNNIGDVDVLTLPSPISGPGNPTIDSYTSIAINLAAGANQVLVSSAANKQIWVYGVAFTVNVAGTVSFQDEDDTAKSGVMQFGATGGMAVPPSGNFAMPLWKLGTDKDLEVDVVTSELDGTLTYAIVSV